MLLTCSGAGEKLRPFVTGNSARRRCFRSLASPLFLPVTYASNRKAWMTSNLFQEWFDKAVGASQESQALA